MGSPAIVAEDTRAQAPGEGASRADGSAARVRRLVWLAKRGDRRALEQLYVLHFDRIYSYLELSLGDRYDAEDLTNQTFIRMLESIGRFAPRQAPFSAWLFRIAHNLAMDHFRTGRRSQPAEELQRGRETTGRSAEDEALVRIGRESMLGMIESLSRDQRQVVTLKFVFGFSNGEIASILGKREGAVKSLQHRALTTLERSLAMSSES